MPSSDTPLIWEIDIPLWTNTFLLKKWFVVTALVFGGCTLFMSIVLLGAGHADAIIPMIEVFALASLLLGVMGWLALWGGYGNRMRFQFEISKQGIRQTLLEKKKFARLRAHSKGSLQAQGASLLNQARQQIVLHWRGAFIAHEHPHRKIIVVRDHWHDLMHIYCTQDNWEAVRNRIAREMAQHGTAARLHSHPSPLPRVLWHTACIVLAELAVLAFVHLVDLYLEVAVGIFLFALVALWLVPLFAWAVLALSGYVVFSLLGAPFTYFDSQDWIVLIAGLGGLGYLAWLSWALLHGRLVSMLLATHGNMEGGED